MGFRLPQIGSSRLIWNEPCEVTPEAATVVVEITLSIARPPRTARHPVASEPLSGTRAKHTLGLERQFLPPAQMKLRRHRVFSLNVLSALESLNFRVRI